MEDSKGFYRLSKRRIYQDVVEQIRELIDEGMYQPGDRLPPERELAELLGVSRTSLREALQSLELLGEVETRVGVNGGTFIREVSLAHALSVFEGLFRRTNQLVTDIVEVRLMLETRSAYHAAERRSDDHLRMIYEAIERMRSSVERGSIGIRDDHDFHISVARATENDFLYGLTQLMEDLVEETRRETLSMPGVPAEAIDDHEQIAQAIKEQDPQGAEDAMQRHLLKAFNINQKLRTGATEGE